MFSVICSKSLKPSKPLWPKIFLFHFIYKSYRLVRPRSDSVLELQTV